MTALRGVMSVSPLGRVGAKIPFSLLAEETEEFDGFGAGSAESRSADTVDSLPDQQREIAKAADGLA